MGLGIILLTLLSALSYADSAEVPFTIFHTNDLHSHFQSDKSAFAKGGYARLKTAIQNAKTSRPHSILLDGGDWSEGSVYYFEEAGRESLRMLDVLGYDFATLGNHDWLNGPDVLLSHFEAVQPQVTLVSANLGLQNYSQADSFRKYIKPFVIKNYVVNGQTIKVAVFGLATFEIIYDKFFSPVKILNPYSIARELAARLKKNADLVILISHNNTAINQELLRDISDIDVIIGAHDHKKLIRPIEKIRSGGRKGWLVEAEKWGNYLGQMDLLINPADNKVELKNYKLIPIDFRTPEDPAVSKKIEQIEQKLESKYGQIFHDHVADCHEDMTREGLESPIGNFTVDAYRNYTHSDLAVDTIKFIYGEAYPGSLHTADLINVNPGVFKVELERPWSVNLLSVTGKDLAWLLGVLLSTRTQNKLELLAFSGVEVNFESLFSKRPFAFLEFSSLDQFQFATPLLPSDKIRIDGHFLEENKTYRVAVGGAVMESLAFLNSLFPDTMRLLQVEDTKTEAWKMMLAYAKSISPITMDKIPIGNRLRTEMADLGILSHNISLHLLEKNGKNARVRVDAWVGNYGSTLSKSHAQVSLNSNRNGFDESLDPSYQLLGSPIDLPDLNPGEGKKVSWDVVVTERNGFYPITVSIDGASGELNQLNQEATRYFKAVELK